MSYQQSETGIASGSPVELFRFSAGAQRWLVTGAAQAVVYAGETYVPTAVRRTAPEITGDPGRTGLEIRLPRDHGIAQIIASGVIEIPIDLVVYRLHRTDVLGEVIVYWRGRVSSGRLTGSELVIRADPPLAALRRDGLRGLYSATCRHALYSVPCGASATLHRIVGTVQSVAGSTLTIPEAASKPDGYFVGGFAKIGDARRTITVHAAAQITMLSPLQSAVVGASIELFAGCDHLLATCRDRFSNVVNFGGFPWLPAKNPHAGDGIA